MHDRSICLRRRSSAQWRRSKLIKPTSWNLKTWRVPTSRPNVTVRPISPARHRQKLLDSPKWKLNRGKAYPVRLVAASRSVDAQALAVTKSVTIALEDSRLNSNLRLARIFEVRGEGATLRVPLDGSSKAFERLETCFSKHDTSETNPFVASSRKP